MLLSCVARMVCCGWVCGDEFLQLVGFDLSFDNAILGIVGSKPSTWLKPCRRRKWILKFVVAAVGSNGSKPIWGLQFVIWGWKNSRVGFYNFGLENFLRFVVAVGGSAIWVTVRSSSSIM